MASDSTAETMAIDFTEHEDLAQFDPEQAAKELLGFASEAGASDVFLTDEPNFVSVRMRRLGRVEALQRLSREAGRRLQNHFRAVGGADVTDHLKPVEGRNVVHIEDGYAVDVRISSLPSVFGQDLALRLFNNDESLMSLENLGLLKGELEAVRNLLDAPSGLLLVAGPTGSGKTNSLYAFLRYLNRGDRKIHTLEEPVEYILPGIVQSQVNVRAGVDFAQLLYAALRHAPDVIMIGEIRDLRTAEIAVRAGGSGQLVLATVHSNTAIGAIQTMAGYDVNPHFLASSLLGVVSQRLIRRLCPMCRMQIDMSDLPRYLSEVADQFAGEFRPSLYMPVGCDQCVDGYDRLTCIPEILKIDSALRRAIADRIDFDRVGEIARSSGLVPFRRSAQLRLATGVTTAEELIHELPDRDSVGRRNELEGRFEPAPTGDEVRATADSVA